MTARHGRITAQSLAQEIWDELKEKPEYKILTNFVEGETGTEINISSRPRSPPRSPPPHAPAPRSPRVAGFSRPL